MGRLDERSYVIHGEPHHYKCDPCSRSTLLPIIPVAHSAKQRPDRPDPEQVMVIVFSVELSAVDQAHRHLKSFVEGCCLLKFCRRASQRIDEP